MTIGLIVGICTLFFMVLHFTTTASYRAYTYSKNKKTNQATQLQQLQQQVADLTSALKSTSK
ncbi:MAG: hypothetical protein J6T10_26045 [Methanobrevibacter sp.]|nr:hypothetical protein [Methanobrevibacter sp.]